MAISQIQNTFTLGELDPLLLSRVDFEGYYKGARKIRNAIVIPQGGIKQRFGTVFVNIIADDIGNLITDKTHVMFLVFTFSQDKSFLIVLRPTIETNTPATDQVSIDIYLDGAIVATLDNTDGVPWTVSQIETLRYIRATDRILFNHHDTQPYQLIRGANDATWTITPQAFVWFPAFDFSPKDGGVAVYTGPGVTFTPSATTGNVTVTVAGATPVTSNHVGGLFYGNGGVLRITAVASTTVFSGFTIEDFLNTNPIRGDRAFLLEPIWGNGGGAVPGAARGWPANGTLYQNRLIYANTVILPNIFAASSTFNFNNFDTSGADDDDAFVYALGSDSLNEINHMIGSTSLVALTTNSLFSTNVLLDAPLTPANVFLNEQSREGSNNVLAHIIDDQILYVNHHGNAVKSVTFDLLQSRFDTTDASLLSPHLIRVPREAAVFDNSIQSEGNYYFLVNGDGSFAVYQSLKNQNVSAWTLSTTQGDFLDVCADREDCYVLVKRQVLGVGDNQVVLKGNQDFSAFIDITAECRDTGSDVELYTDVDDSGDYLIFGNSSPFTTVGFSLSAFATNSIDPIIEYLDKTNTWTPIPNVVDTTSGMTMDGIVQWAYSDVIDWAPMTVNEIERKFWMRIQRTNDNVVTMPTEDILTCDKQDAIAIEQLDFAFILDAVYEATSDNNGLITGLDYLSGQQVWLLKQTSRTYNVHAGIPIGPKFVNAFGEVQLSEDFADMDFVVGIDAPPEIIPMPPVAQLSIGINVYLPKYTQSMFVDYYLSAGLIVANREIPVLAVGFPALDTPLNLSTGFWEISPYPSRNPREEIPIRRTAPLPFTLIGVGYKVDF